MCRECDNLKQSFWLTRHLGGCSQSIGYTNNPQNNSTIVRIAIENVEKNKPFLIK